MIEAKSPFWWRQTARFEKAPNYSLGQPLPGSKPGEYGYDRAVDLQTDIENLSNLFHSDVSPSTKRIARLALEPLLVGAGMTPYEFERQYPKIAPEPTSFEKAGLDLKKVNQLIAFVNGVGEAPTLDED